MTFDWSDVYDIAAFVADHDFGAQQEAALRTALSRAYYAAFNWAKVWCENQGCSFGNNSSDHEGVRVYLRSLGHPDLADHLYRMHRYRKLADYEQHFQGNMRLMWLGSSTAAQQIFSSLT